MAKHNSALIAVHDETFSLLPYLLHASAGETAKCVPFHHPYTRSDPPNQSLHALHQQHNPRFAPCTVRVLNSDSFDAALSMPGPAITLPPPGKTYRDVPRPPLVLNLANAQRAGGGWHLGTTAQEESLCYRSSLPSALPTRHSSLGVNRYPWRANELFLAPCVVVIRKGRTQGNALLPIHEPTQLRMLSVVSCAAVKGPPVVEGRDKSGHRNGRMMFADGADRRLTREKIRGILRLAGRERYTRLVLGALGCGAFAGPGEEVATLFREVLEDPEFRGWFQDVTFAVMKGSGASKKDNFTIFRDELEGVVVGSGR